MYVTQSIPRLLPIEIADKLFFCSSKKTQEQDGFNKKAGYLRFRPFRKLILKTLSGDDNGSASGSVLIAGNAEGVNSGF